MSYDWSGPSWNRDDHPNDKDPNVNYHDWGVRTRRNGDDVRFYSREARDSEWLKASASTVVELEAWA